MSYLLALSGLADAGDAAAGGLLAGAGVFMLLFWGVLLLGTIFWIWMLVDCLVSSMPTNEKILWALVIFFLHLLGAIIYYFVKRGGQGVATPAT